jgi:hypothetical protein
MEGYGFLQMIERKIKWVQKNLPQLLQAVIE